VQAIFVAVVELWSFEVLTAAVHRQRGSPSQAASTAVLGLEWTGTVVEFVTLFISSQNSDTDDDGLTDAACSNAHQR
jgi:hypothetical protein